MVADSPIPRERTTWRLHRRAQMLGGHARIAFPHYTQHVPHAHCARAHSSSLVTRVSRY